MDSKSSKKQGQLYKIDSSSQHDLNLINTYTITDLDLSDVFLFTIKLCNNDIDRVFDCMTDTFLDSVASNIKGLTGLLDHDWSTDNQLSRIYDACVVEEDGVLNQLGKPLKYVLCKVYTLSKYTDFIDKINSGLLREVSISFESTGDVCSICGAPMTKDGSGVGHCENGHTAGVTYDGILCYNIINNLSDLLEWSLVAVPCQRGASIKNKHYKGGCGLMKRAEFLIKQFVTSKAVDSNDPALKEVMDVDVTTDMTDADIDKLLKENADLRARIDALEAELASTKSTYEREHIESVVDKALDDAGLVYPEVKSLIKKEMDFDTFTLEQDGKIPGLDDVVDGLKSKYSNLFVTESDTESIGGHDEPDGDEAGLVYTDKREPDGDEGKLMVMGKSTKKSLNKPNKLNASSYQSNKASKKSVKPGIYFN